MAEPLSFEALPSSEYVRSTAENYVLYVLLEALASGAAGSGGARLPLNLGIVIDRSLGSMYDERRLEFVVEAVKFLARGVAPQDKVAVVAFADKAQVIVHPDQIHNGNVVRQALDDLDLLEIGGGTQMALGMRAGIDEVKRNLEPNRLNRVLVLTDGQTYEETACIDLAGQNRDQMSFSTMGVGCWNSTKNCSSGSLKILTASIISSAIHPRFRGFLTTNCRACAWCHGTQRTDRSYSFTRRTGARGIPR